MQLLRRAISQLFTWPCTLDTDNDRLTGELADQGSHSRQGGDLEGMDQIIPATQAPEGQEHEQIDKEMPKLPNSQGSTTPVESADPHHRKVRVLLSGSPASLVAQRHNQHLLAQLAQVSGLLLRLGLRATDAWPELKSDKTNTHMLFNPLLPHIINQKSQWPPELARSPMMSLATLSHPPAVYRAFPQIGASSEQMGGLSRPRTEDPQPESRGHESRTIAAAR